MAKDYTLYELNSALATAVSKTFTGQYRVIAEISELRENSSGHCYMELIQKNEEGNTIAKARANVWAPTYRKLCPFFEHATGIKLKSGIKILVTVKVSFDPLYQYSLTVWDIDPAYTIGDMAVRRTEILKRLQNDGVVDDNKNLTLCAIPKRIAVISSATAAGYGDFCDQLKHNSKGYVFYPVLFKALMQGEQAAESIIGALNRIYNNIEMFDCVVIIRGGGATSELNCFDDYNLAFNITQFPLPVIVGIGHERDITVLDYVAFRSIKTPTAVAEFLISQVSTSDDYLNELSGEIVERIRILLSESSLKLANTENRIPSLILNRIERERNKVSQVEKLLSMNINQRVGKELVAIATKSATIKGLFERVIEREKSKLAFIENNIELSSPDKILKRGYSIVVKDGYAVKSVNEIDVGDCVNIVFADGESETEIKSVKL